MPSLLCLCVPCKVLTCTLGNHRAPCCEGLLLRPAQQTKSGGANRCCEASAAYPSYEKLLSLLFFFSDNNAMEVPSRQCPPSEPKPLQGRNQGRNLIHATRPFLKQWLPSLGGSTNLGIRLNRDCVLAEKGRNLRQESLQGWWPRPQHSLAP